MNCSIYIHVPFCRSRCNYCDFNTFAGKDNLIPSYIKALCKEIVHVSNVIRDIPPIHTIYIGGGTPSLLPTEYLSLILSSIRTHYSLEQGCEITIEANPGTLNGYKLENYLTLGINRLSIGVQSLHRKELKILGRIHSSEEVYYSINEARRLGFENINADIIYGIPGQTLSSLRETLDNLLNLGLNHLSAYSLSIEQDTPLEKMIHNNLVVPCEDDLIADMYEALIDWLKDEGYLHYEISNWAKVVPGKDYRCKHNLQYWYYEPWLGFGAGASSFFNKTRFTNLPNIEEYIERCENGVNEIAPFIVTNELDYIGLDQEMDEAMMMGLRLVQEGVHRQRFLDRFGKDYLDIYPHEIDQLMKDGLLEFWGNENKILRLTRKGILLGNLVFMRFLRSES